MSSNNKILAQSAKVKLHKQAHLCIKKMEQMVTYSEKHKLFIGAASILSGILALACMVVGVFATNFDFEAFGNPLRLLNNSTIDPVLLRWFMLLDLFGYYLLLLPLVFYIHSKLVHKTPFALLLTNLGYGYVLVGAIGAATLSVIWPAIFEQHLTADEAARSFYRADFSLATDFVVKGLWNHLEVLLGGIWWIGTGRYAIENKALKITSIILGFSCLLDGFGEVLGITILAETGLNIYLILGIVWPIWLGVTIIKRKF
jgi:hypothetical protein